ncbi:MAG TPA: tyrosine-type recombinase/integrase [Ktedonobacteraceae bacterium]|nr:tyrosine-type recombinase/integrase [Ktedonobacteraceae bacterium]
MELNGENGAIAHFLLDCRARNRSHWTLKQYGRTLHTLCDLLQELCQISELEQVTVLHLRQCVYHLLTTPVSNGGRRPNNGKTLSAQSVQDYVQVWKAFFNWCYQEELIEKNPVSRLKSPTVEKKIKPTLTPDEIQMILDSCDLSTSLGFRDYVILSLMVDAGLRRDEVAHLHVGDVCEGYIKVHGKGRKEREVGLHPEVEKLLWKYIQKHRHPWRKNETGLFLGRYGRPLKTAGIATLVDRIKRQCGFEDKQLSPHMFRHTFSKQYMERGGDVLSLSRELGHSDIQVTRLYLGDFGSTEARKDHGSRSVFNDIKVHKRKVSRKRQEE